MSLLGATFAGYLVARTTLLIVTQVRVAFNDLVFLTIIAATTIMFLLLTRDFAWWKWMVAISAAELALHARVLLDMAYDGARLKLLSPRSKR